MHQERVGESPSWERAAGLVALAGLSFFVLAVTELPYRTAANETPLGQVYGGQIDMAPDIDMYFSYIRQAAAGHVIFRNNLTHIPHERSFFNPQWLAVGWSMSLLHLTESQAFKLWRAAGVFLLVFGFAQLARVCLPDANRRRVAILMCAIGGGFGWLIYILAAFGVADVSEPVGLKNPAMDVTISIQSFIQMMKNPHFSLPHGLTLFALAFFLLGETTRKTSYYWYSAAMCLVEGFIRPYDLIILAVVIPMYTVLEALVSRRVELRESAFRALPLIVASPALLYYVYLFSFHPIFKYWASQGHMPFIPVYQHVLSMGLPALLCVVRLVRQRLDAVRAPMDRFLLIWTCSVGALFHAYKVVPFMPYSPQLGVPLMGTMILFAVRGLTLPDGDVLGFRNGRVLAAAAGLVVINALTSPIAVVRAVHDSKSNPENYIRAADRDAFEWLRWRVKEDDVILSDLETGNRMAKFVNARFVLAHWSVTPDFDQMRRRVNPVLNGNAPRRKVEALLQELRPNWIYVAVREPEHDLSPIATVRGVHLEYDSPEVAIFSYSPPG